ncbi:MAG: hypothetical protein GEV09_09415 [Pseudonocardiaceae bacterium]|nr:hypothetical protein [Pseudonocardiaceae bacterium]
MKRVGAILAGTALLAALGACADRPAGVGFGGAPEPAPPGSAAPAPEPPPGGPTPPPGGIALPAAQVDATALPDGHPRLVWTEQGGTVVGLYGQEGGCSRVRAELTEQATRNVRVELVESIPTTGPCTMDLRFPPLFVRLDEPVGDRTVVLERRTVGPPATGGDR